MSDWQTRSGFELERTFTPESVASRGIEDLAEWVGVPGEPPFTRGIDREGYRRQPWIIGQYAGFGTADDANARLRMLLERGQTGLSIALDLPTQMGFDSDHELARGEVGKIGVAIDSLADMEMLLDGIPLERVRQIRTTANAIGPIWLAMIVVLGEQRGFDPGAVRILIQNDVLKEYIARSTFIYPPEPALRLAVDTIEHCARHLPSWTPLAMSGYHIRETGSTAVQELAFTFANGIAYADAAVARGLSIDDFAPRLFTFLSAGHDLLEEVAKFRAARRVWSRLVEERYSPADPDSGALRIFAFSAGSNLTAQQPMNNMARVTLAALSAVLGSAQTLHTASFDEAFGTPTVEAARAALGTQQVLMEETNLIGTADPLGGSWAIESLTSDIEEAVGQQLREIEEQGGALACIENGWFRARLDDSAYEDQLAVQSGERKVVGVNVHRDDSDALSPAVFATDPKTESQQIARLEAVRGRRDQGDVEAALGRLREDAATGANVVPATIEAVRAYATVGEIADVLREVFGSYGRA
ncbi:MAG: methylmalonyl-CoA mutase [Actinobacteria bacterium]|nr:methylmalonyl-CoA mutase [Actinomycetota bacterium]